MIKQLFMYLLLLGLCSTSVFGQLTEDQIKIKQDNYKVNKDEVVFVYSKDGLAPAWKGVTSSATRHTYEGAPPVEVRFILGAESSPGELKGLVLPPELMEKVLDIQIIVPSNDEPAVIRPEITESPIDIPCKYGTSLRNVYKFKIAFPNNVGSDKQYIIKLKVKKLDLLGKKSLRMGSDNCLADTFVFDVRKCKTPADKDALLYMQTMYKVETDAPDALDALKSIVKEKKYNDKNAILGLLQSIGDLCIKKGIIEEGIAWSLLSLRYNHNQKKENTAYSRFCDAIENAGGWEKVILMEPAINEKYRKIDKEYMGGFTPAVDWTLKDLEEPYDKGKKEEEEYKTMEQMISSTDETNYQELIGIIKEKNSEKVNLAYNKLLDVLKTTKKQDVKKELSDYLLSRCNKKPNDSAFSFKVSTYLSDDIKDDLVRKIIVKIHERIKTFPLTDWIVKGSEKQLKDFSLGVLKENFNMGSETFPFGEFEFSIRAILARCGKKEHLEKSIEMGKYLSRNDPTMAFQIWAYIRQPETIDILKQYLSDENSKQNVEAMKYLSECLIGFPYDPKDKAQNEDIPKTLETSRQWMKANYNPRKINSSSVLIDGKIYDNIGKDSEGKTP